MSQPMVDDRELDGWLALARAPGVDGASARRLHARFGSAAGIAQRSARDLQAAGLGAAAIEAVRQPDAKGVVEDRRWLERPGRTLLPITDPAFPALLGAIDDAPAALFVAGDPAALALPQFAIVGSRNPTPDGAQTAAAFARHLADCGLSIVSGLASGIDGAAHRGALAGEAVTVAVYGTGLDQVYPPSHRKLAGEIAERGALISEFPTRTPPRRGNFPRRNRIISGLAVGTLVVEAARRSGSLITAHLAIEQGREVFAVPGSIHNPLARGCHLLIREGAKLVESGDDILDELAALVGLHVAAPERKTDAPTPATEDDEDYCRLLNALAFDPVSADTIIERTGLTADAVSSMLLILELQGRVLAVPGGRYVRASEGVSRQ